MHNYRTPDNFLASLALEFDGSQYLFGMTTAFTLQAPGSHRIFPYCTGGNSFDTRSTEDSVVGRFSYSGLLIGELALLRSLIFEKLGVIQYSGVRLRISDFETGTTILYTMLQDYRIGTLSLDSALFGNTTMVNARIEVTFRDFYILP
jgi:hypothetical protein